MNAKCKNIIHFVLLRSEKRADMDPVKRALCEYVSSHVVYMYHRRKERSFGRVTNGNGHLGLDDIQSMSQASSSSNFHEGGTAAAVKWICEKVTQKNLLKKRSLTTLHATFPICWDEIFFDGRVSIKALWSKEEVKAQHISNCIVSSTLPKSWPNKAVPGAGEIALLQRW